jgi:hypothetical protein
MTLGGALLVGACSRSQPPEPVDTAVVTVETASEGDSDVPEDSPAPTSPCEGVRPPTPAEAVPATAVRYARRMVGAGGEHSCLFSEDLDRDGHVDVGWIDDDATLNLLWGQGAGAPLADRHVLEPGRVEDYGACTPIPNASGDGWDVLVSGAGALYRLVQSTPRTFVDAGAIATMPDAMRQWGQRTSLVAPVDLDRTGPLDLIIGFYGLIGDACVSDAPTDTDQAVDPAWDHPGAAFCYVAQPDGSYALDDGALCPSPVLTSGVQLPYSVAIHDFDGDGVLDAAIAVDFGVNTLLKGRPEGGFSTWPSGHGFDVYNHAMGIGVSDFDLDGVADIFVSDIGVNDVYQGFGCGTWFRANDVFGTVEATKNVISWGVSTLDVDRNGAPDVFVPASLELTSGFEQPLCNLEELGLPGPKGLQFLNTAGEAGRRLERVDVPLYDQPVLPGYFGEIRLTSADLDEDGRPDFVLGTREGVVALDNRIPSQGHWLRVRALGPQGLPAYGAAVTVRTATGGGWWGTQWPGNGTSGHREMVVDVGLGAQDGPVSVEVRWPDGASVVLDDVAVDQRIDVAHP